MTLPEWVLLLVRAMDFSFPIPVLTSNSEKGGYYVVFVISYT